MSQITQKYNQKSRSIFLGDIENLAWDTQASTLTLDSIRSISQAVNIELQSFTPLEVVASSHHFAKQIWFGWGRTTRRLLGSGPDGADKALLSLIKKENPGIIDMERRNQQRRTKTIKL